MTQVHVLFTDDAGNHIDAKETTLARLKDENPSLPAQWVILKDIRDTGRYELAGRGVTMTVKLPTFTATVYRFTGEHGSTTVSEAEFTSKAKACAEFMRLAPQYISDRDVFVSLTADHPNGQGGTVLASKSRRATHAELNPGFFGV